MDLKEKIENMTDLDRQILSVAKIEFEKNGYYHTNIDFLAEKLEIGKGTVYRHFGSKMFLFAAVIMDLFFKTSIYIEEVREIKDVNQAMDVFINRIEESIRNGHLMKQASSSEDMRVFSQEMGSSLESKKIMEYMTKMQNSMMAVLSDIIQRGMDQGLYISNIPMPETSWIIMSVIVAHVMQDFFPKNQGMKDHPSGPPPMHRAGLVDIKKFILRSITNEEK